ncbi:LacI family transcriptional regulator [Salinibacterium sp. SYSU T00001]|uniref:LacI family DNA-binding transcriptional regulator n=1 Tax=Homoserinimonas sedimenticola TaxID=2986805 RepID=UPI0022356362|nr:LacI family DNA-binding transcriptional regulator [Salinibacterium sedimenticola]MCW4385631.1 LacI family transcriptional regulator [Salinibacterium sedimenticola]
MNASVKDVAARAGVSVGTVSNVLNRPDKVSPATAQRVHAAIAELGFVRNDAARQLRAGRSRAIGMVLLDVANPFFSELARGAEERAVESGHALILGNSDEKADREARYLDLFEEQRMHGVLVSPAGDVDARLELLRERGIPSVLVDRGSDAFSSVSVDDVAGGELAVRHLVSLGRKRIAYVCGPLTIRQVADRLEGARRVVAQHPDVTIEVVSQAALTVPAGAAAGTALAARAAADRPDAVFAANDLLALGVLQSLVMLGDVSVPGDVALIGYDDIAFARSAVVPLTSIRQPSRAIGATAVEILLEEAAEPTLEKRAVVFQPELVVRASTAATPWR